MPNIVISDNKHSLDSCYYEVLRIGNLVEARLLFHLKGPCSWFRSNSCVLNKGRAPAPFLRAGHRKPLDGVALAAAWLVGGVQSVDPGENRPQVRLTPSPPLHPLHPPPSPQPRPLNSGHFGRGRVSGRN